jgi:hypothetical protein
MMTEEQFQKYELAIHTLDRRGHERCAHIVAHLCEEVRALKERLAELEKPKPS